MKLSKSTASIAVLHLFVLLVSDAAINLKMLRDPRSIRLKQNIFQQRHTSGEFRYDHTTNNNRLRITNVVSVSMVKPSHARQ
jgi:hypothetical protein